MMKTENWTPKQKAVGRKVVMAIVNFEKKVFFNTGIRLPFLRAWWKFDGARLQAALDAEHNKI